MTTPQEKRWHVALGDPTCVFTGDLAQPIRCHSQQRATLIAAVPDLLAALKAIAENDSGSRPRDWLATARAAIAKAEGRCSTCGGEHPIGCCAQDGHGG